MKNYLIRLLLYICIAMVPIACGTRKAGSKVTDTKQKDITREESKGSTSKETTARGSNTTTDQAAKVDEQQEKRVRELFNENGTLKERITELLNRKSTDNSTHTETRTFLITTRVDSVFNNTIYRDRTITIHTKDKQTERSNNGWYWVVGISVVLLGAMWLKPWK